MLKEICLLEVEDDDKQDLQFAFSGMGSSNCCTVDEAVAIYGENVQQSDNQVEAIQVQ